MAEIGKNLKNFWMKGMEAIGNTASNIASNTKFKVDEMSLLNRRREILADFGSKAYALWQKGVEFPEELQEQLRELGELDEKLNDLRAEKYAGTAGKGNGSPDAVAQMEEQIISQEEADAEAASDAEEKTGEISKETAEEIAEEIEKAGEDEKIPEPAISDLFSDVPSVDTMAEKVNNSLDQLGQNLKKFSKEIDDGLEDLTEKLVPEPVVEVPETPAAAGEPVPEQAKKED